MRPASEVDHKVNKARAKKLGWTDAQIEADDNLAAINKDCHRLKTQLEAGGTPKRRIGLDGYPIED